MVRDKLSKYLEKTWGKKVKLEHPADPSNGDFSTNIAMTMGKNPMAIAKKLLKAFKKPDYIKKVEIAKPGFINFWLSKKALTDELNQALKAKNKYGQGKNLTGKTILVEYAHPNTHKLFHIGHLRNITTGESIARLLESQGAKVTRANYQGDIGLHIAKTLYGIMNSETSFFSERAGIKEHKKSLNAKIKFLSQAYIAGNKAYEEDKKAKKEIEKINQKIYAGNTELVKLLEETKKWSLDYFDRIYKRLYTKFDRLYFESEVSESGKKLVEENIGKVFKKDQGAVIFEGGKHGLHNRVFINKLGLPTYEGKDVGLAYLQVKEFSPDFITHIVGPEQTGYFEVLFKALETLDPQFKGKEKHIVYGWVRLKYGKMSSRAGDVIEGEWAIEEAKKRLQKSYKMPDTVAEQVAIGAVKYSLLKPSTASDIAFDIDESIDLEGNSGPYLQYTYARTQSVLRKALGSRSVGNRTRAYSSNHLIPSGIKLRLIPNSEEDAILRTFYRFPEVVQEAAQRYGPSLVCTYLYDLAQKYNTFYNKHRIIQESGSRNQEAGGKRTQAFRLRLTMAVGGVLKSGLNLLGIQAPERM